MSIEVMTRHDIQFSKGIADSLAMLCEHPALATAYIDEIAGRMFKYIALCKEPTKLGVLDGKFTRLATARGGGPGLVWITWTVDDDANIEAVEKGMSEYLEKYPKMLHPEIEWMKTNEMGWQNRGGLSYA